MCLSYDGMGDTKSGALAKASKKKGIEISDPDARLHVYGISYNEWKEKYQK